MLVAEEIRHTRNALRYGYAVGKVKVLETRTLDSAAYERLLDAPTFAEQKRLLSESPYGRFIERAETPADVERALDEALEHFYGFLDEAALPEAVTRFFRLRYDFANFKAVLKARMLGADEEGLLVDHGTIPGESFREDLAQLPEPFGSLALRLREADRLGTAAADTAVDQAMFAELLRVAEKSGSRFLVHLARLAIDLANVKTLVRARRSGYKAGAVEALLVPGGSVELSVLGPLADLERQAMSAALERIPELRPVAALPLEPTSALDASLDAVSEAALRGGRMGQVGPEPVIAYVFARESEVAALRVLLLGRLTGIDNETIRRHIGVRG